MNKSAIIPCQPPVCHSPNWKNELANAITSPAELLKRLNLEHKIEEVGKAECLFKLKVPEPYVQRMEKGNPNDPLFLQVWPSDKEFVQVEGYSNDPLEEKSFNTIPGLLHKYGERVLTITTASCAINCRYCFRRHFDYQGQLYHAHAWQHWMDYIRQHPEVNEVILSGGEPLLLSDEKLTELVSHLEQIPQLKRIRIHSRLPLVVPSRITEKLVNLIASSRFQWILVWHINHPNEIDQAVIDAAHKLYQAGCYQFNQSVLLKEINASTEVLAQLSEDCFSARITPYYLHVLDHVAGTAHFELSIEEIETIYKGLQAKLPGFLVPKLVQERPNELSKTQLAF